MRDRKQVRDKYKTDKGQKVSSQRSTGRQLEENYSEIFYVHT